MTELVNRSQLEPVIDEGIKNINFFQGRLLTAQDMRDAQHANYQQHWQLGRAMGAGVVHGLQVELVEAGGGNVSPVVSVSSGLAFNAEGQAVELSIEKVHIALSRTPPPGTPDAGVFKSCQPPQNNPDLVGKGAYLFVMTPISSYSESVPLVELYSSGKATGCGDRYAVEGVTFRLIELTPKTLPGASEELRTTIAELMSASEQTSLEPEERQASLSKLRNLLAHLFLGTMSPNLHPLTPAPPPTAPGLESCDVPLALIYWTLYGVRFVDMWAVRRRPIPQAAPPFSSTATGEAMLYQFAQHIDDVVHTSELSGLLSTLQMKNFFRYLPPCGVIPTTELGAPGGFFPKLFLQGLAHRLVFIEDPAVVEGTTVIEGTIVIEGATMRSLYHDALYYPPIDLESDEFFWLYQVREQMQAAASGEPGSLLFANGHIPYRGDARFNQARWSYSNVASQPIY